MKRSFNNRSNIV